MINFAKVICPCGSHLWQSVSIIFKFMETLHTARLLLRPWEISDAEALYTQAHNPIIGKRCGWPPHKSVEESREIIEVVLSKPHSFAICLANNIPIGSIGLLSQGESNLLIGENEANYQDRKSVV